MKNSDIEALSEALERLKVPTFNIKMEENPMGYCYTRLS